MPENEHKLDSVESEIVESESVGHAQRARVSRFLATVVVLSTASMIGAAIVGSPFVWMLGGSAGTLMLALLNAVRTRP